MFNQEHRIGIIISDRFNIYRSKNNVLTFGHYLNFRIIVNILLLAPSRKLHGRSIYVRKPRGEARQFWGMSSL